MRIISVNVGLPREVSWKGRIVTTGIFKQPVHGSVKAHTLNLDGDRQADLTVHGGRDKAVYAYPSEHYDFWRAELADVNFPWGKFGENLTTEGLDERDVDIGDRLSIGSALFQVTQPRMPCYKLALKFGRDDILKRFLTSRRTGFYLAVIEEGELQSGSEISILKRDGAGLKVSAVTEIYVDDGMNRKLLERAVSNESLPQPWRDYFRKRLDGLK